MEPEDLLRGSDIGMNVYERLQEVVSGLGTFEVKTSKSQITFRRRRGFAYLWRPGQYLRNPTAEVVLSIVLGRHDESDRFKEVAHPSRRHWMHHLELHTPGEIDSEVVGWLREAMDRAG